MSNPLGDADPQHLRAFGRLMDAVDALATLRIRSENTTAEELCAVPVTDAMMDRLAASPDASAELRAYADRVALGEARWNDIELWADPVPREVTELKTAPQYEWLYRPTPKPVPDEPVRALRPDSVFRRGQIVGPSDWEDDEEPPRSWLV